MQSADSRKIDELAKDVLELQNSNTNTTANTNKFVISKSLER